MALNTSTGPGAMTGARYIESLKDGREVWLDGQRVADVTTHPALSGMVHELARIYDLQHTPEYRDEMTFRFSRHGWQVQRFMAGSPVDGGLEGKAAQQ